MQTPKGLPIMTDIASELTSLPVFADAEPEALAALVSICEERTVDQGTILIRQGEPHDAAFVVLHGSVGVVTDDYAYPSIRPGGIVGEMELFIGCDGAPSTVTTRGESNILVIDHAGLDEVMAAHPSLWRGLALEFGRRLRILDTAHTQWNRTHPGITTRS